MLERDGLVETPLADADASAQNDITRAPLDFPAERTTRLQTLARGDEGFLLALAYSTQRGLRKDTSLCR